MIRCYVSIGSNIAREQHIAAGLKSLAQKFGDLDVSSIVESDPVGFSGDPFYNLVVGFDSYLDVKELARQLRDLEFEQGRSPDSKKFSSRTLDLDLILYGDFILNEGGLQLPRIDIERYAFVLEPLAEIAPNLKHPVLGISYQELWQQMPKEGLRQRRIKKMER